MSSNTSVSLTIRSSKACELIDITDAVRAAIEQLRLDEGVCHLHCPHTTAGLTISEHADPDVAHDLSAALDRLVPDGISWRHREGNSPAHLKAALVGCSVFVPVRSGRMALGTWQGVFLCEFDGPRTRTVEAARLP